MYEQHFGLKKRPFRANATGTDVFVGPHIAATMAGLKQALAKNDAIATVSGPTGSGKTTLVNRALESMGQNTKIVSVARMRLDSHDVLEFLLDELGVQEKPSGTIQKFTVLRRFLKSLEGEDTRVFIAIEDGVRLGADTLAELEALTAADAGESEGASVVVMGDEGLDAVLGDAQLVRIQQRIRKRFTSTALPMPELRGYLRHCFRLAGNDFEQIFEANAAALLHHLSHGIPRIANNLVESAMTVAADQDLVNVPSSLVARIAENEYGLSAAGFDLTAQPITQAPPTPEVIEESAAAPAQAPVVDDVPEAIAELPDPEPVVVFAEPEVSAEPESTPDDIVPELIQDTLPDLAILAPELELAAAATQPEPLPELQPEPEHELLPDPEPDVIPVLQSEPVTLTEVASEPEPEPEPEVVLAVEEEPLVVESAADEVPDWDRDPTMAELRPDLAELEKAMAFAKGDDPEPESGPIEEVSKAAVEDPEKIPEITLDHAISQNIEDNLIDEPGEISAPQPAAASAGADTDIPAIRMPQRQNKKGDAEIERITAELAKAKSIEDVDDKLAETLFGDELNFIAAQVLANPPSFDSANDDLDVAVGQQVANGTKPEMEVTLKPEMEVTLEAPRSLDNSGMDLSASQRLKTVRALNADVHPSIREPEAVVTASPEITPTSAPDPIEDQITSMTQTLKALKIEPPVTAEDDDERRGGFFSRFKRS
jgi:type II secretory pathway predicted ATPase ExeA